MGAQSKTTHNPGAQPPLSLEELQHLVNEKKGKDRVIHVAKAIHQRMLQWSKPKDIIQLLEPLIIEIQDREPIHGVLSQEDETHTTFKKKERELLWSYAIASLAVSYAKATLFSEGARSNGVEALRISSCIRDLQLQASAYDNLGWIELRAGNIPESLALHKKAYESSKRSNDPSGIARALNNLALVYKKKGEFNEAIEACDISIELLQSIENGEHFLHIPHHTLGGVYQASGIHDKAIVNYTLACQYSEREGQEVVRQSALISLGEAYRAVGDPAHALTLYREAYNLAKEQLIVASYPSLLCEIGRLHIELEEFSEAEQVLNESIKEAEKVGNSLIEAKAHTTLAETLVRKGDYRTALSLFRAALLSYEAGGDKNSQSYLHAKIGDVHLKRGQMKSATNSFGTAYALTLETGNRRGQERTLYHLAQLSLRRGNTGEALDLYRRSIDVADPEIPSETAMKAHKEIAEIHQGAGNIEIALKEYQRYHELCMQRRESIANEHLHKQRALFQVDKFKDALHIERLKRERTESELQLMQMKLSQAAFDLEERGAQIHTVSAAIKSIVDNLSEDEIPEVKRALRRVTQEIDNTVANDRKVMEYLNLIDPTFFDHLQKSHPSLTPNQIKLCGLIKAGLTSKEIASILYITLDAVKKARYRLRKVFNLKTKERLESYLFGLGGD